MPRWDLRCPKCSRLFEGLTFVSAEDRDRWLTHIVCDDCHVRLEVAPPAPNFVLKGAGFHKNDYAKERK
jgi:predicted nucleic acid-binding Zn ribbon protein